MEGCRLSNELGLSPDRGLHQAAILFQSFQFFIRRRAGKSLVSLRIP
jgi:hypothetical protein